MRAFYLLLVALAVAMAPTTPGVDALKLKVRAGNSQVDQSVFAIMHNMLTGKFWMDDFALLANEPFANITASEPIWTESDRKMK